MQDKKQKHGSARRVQRREFLVEGAAAASAAALLANGCSDEGVDDPAPVDQGVDGPAPVDLGARVVDVKDEKSVGDKGALDAARVKAMLHAGLKDLTKQDDLARAWKVLIPDFSAKTRVGIKISGINWKVCSSPEMIKALIGTLNQDLGVDLKNIIVWDKTSWELTLAKLTEKELGVRVQGTVASPEGPGYEKTPLTVLGTKCQLSNILTQLTDVTINCGVLKSHDLAGVTGALKNVYGMFTEPGDFHKNINTAIPELYGLSQVKKSMRLCINEAFLAVASGGPMGSASHKPGRLLLSVDPVAIDAHVLKLINGLRTTPVPEKRLKWIDGAVSKGLGSMTPELITRVM